MKYDVFISYRRDNGFFKAQVIRDRLESIGVKCFLDLQELQAGTFDDKLLNAIRQAPNFLILLTEGALDRCFSPSDWVRKEITEAMDQGKNIIPIMYNGFEWPDSSSDMPEEINKLKLYQAVPGTIDYLSAMIDKVLSFLVDFDAAKHDKIKNRSVLPPVKDTFCVGATSFTTVVDSIIEGWDCGQILREYGFEVKNRTYQWSDKILRDLASGKIDMAIYNKESCLKFNHTHDDQIKIVRDVCSSMGGRNFYILASRKGRWTNLTYQQFKNSLDEDTVIGVSKSSDMYQNLLYILDMTEEELLSRGVKILDYSAAQGLNLFDVFPNILIIAGQDIRYLARRKNDYFELINYEDFPEEKKDFFYRNSVNSLLLGPSGAKKLEGINIDNLGVELMLSFYRNLMNENYRNELYHKLSWSLRDICDDEEDLDYIIRNIIFETYRIL